MGAGSDVPLSASRHSEPKFRVPGLVHGLPPAWILTFLPCVCLLSHLCFLCADPARVLNMPPVIYVPVGIHGYIRCPVDAEPPATVVKWNKDGRPLQVEKVLERCVLGDGVRAPPSTVMPPWAVDFCQDSWPLPKALGKQRAASVGVSGLRGSVGTTHPRLELHAIPRAAWPSWDPAWDGAWSL